MREAGDTDRIEKLAVAIIETLSRPYEVDQNTLYIGASVGVAIGPRDGRTAEMLIRSEEHTSELQSLMRISYAVFCLKKKKKKQTIQCIMKLNKDSLHQG